MKNLGIFVKSEEKFYFRILIVLNKIVLPYEVLEKVTLFKGDISALLNMFFISSRRSEILFRMRDVYRVPSLALLALIPFSHRSPRQVIHRHSLLTYDV